MQIILFIKYDANGRHLIPKAFALEQDTDERDAVSAPSFWKNITIQPTVCLPLLMHRACTDTSRIHRGIKEITQIIVRGKLTYTTVLLREASVAYKSLL